MMDIKFKKIFGIVESGAILFVLAVVLVLAIGTKGLWLKNLPYVLILAAPVGIVSVGQAMLLISGEVDLSVGSVYALVGLSFILFMSSGFGVMLSLLFSIALSCIMGLLHALVVMKLNVPSMIVTLGMMFLYRGLVYILTRGVSLHIPHSLENHLLIKFLGEGLLGIRSSILLLILIAAILIVILTRTRFGNHLFAVGRDPFSAITRGVSPFKVKMIAFVVCTFLAGLVGIIIACQEGEIYSTSGTNLELETIAAAVIGGCVLSGGIGSIWGTVLGAFCLLSLKGGLLMMGAPPYWYECFVGLILIIFLIVSKLLIRGYHGKFS